MNENLWKMMMGFSHVGCYYENVENLLVEFLPTCKCRKNIILRLKLHGVSYYYRGLWVSGLPSRDDLCTEFSREC